jgi:hypothetical protein
MLRLCMVSPDLSAAFRAIRTRCQVESNAAEGCNPAHRFDCPRRDSKQEKAARRLSSRAPCLAVKGANNATARASSTRYWPLPRAMVATALLVMPMGQAEGTSPSETRV